MNFYSSTFNERDNSIFTEKDEVDGLTGEINTINLNFNTMENNFAKLAEQMKKIGKFLNNQKIAFK
ncbi:hypothetical protein A0H76_2807 [Hepatospora eriocheir]|uniref:Uncharacterized protein n=1 Tax=Hepatospora eriocheir TaxID=1081669 RepID=A0A1X0QJK7_9MICR|nr:hypothetical protein A0H76_2807 [Hepatospora eriocheir]